MGLYVTLMYTLKSFCSCPEGDAAEKFRYFLIHAHYIDLHACITIYTIATYLLLDLGLAHRLCRRLAESS